MGLDVTAYSRVLQIPGAVYPESGWEEHEWDETHVLAFAYDGFPHSYAGLAMPDRRFTFSGMFGGGSNIGGVWYDATGAEVYGFAAGSYGGYNAWRDRLSEVFLRVPARVVWADADRYREQPFFELVHNADNEGVIGPVASAALAEDFERYAAVWVEALRRDPNGDWFREKYRHWAKATRLAADTGLIRLH